MSTITGRPLAGMPAASGEVDSSGSLLPHGGMTAGPWEKTSVR
jgi:hypothetical protein